MSCPVPLFSTWLGGDARGLMKHFPELTNELSGAKSVAILPPPQGCEGRSIIGGVVTGLKWQSNEATRLRNTKPLVLAIPAAKACSVHGNPQKHSFILECRSNSIHEASEKIWMQESCLFGRQSLASDQRKKMCRKRVGPEPSWYLIIHVDSRLWKPLTE